MNIIQEVRSQKSGLEKEFRIQKSVVRIKKRIVFVFILNSGYCLLYSAFCWILVSPASALTVQEAAKELACPCECPLVLEDCNMSCGLDWKDQIGEMIKQGKTKEEIVKYFVDKYGDDAKITPMQRLRGKFYQYTRGFDTKEWVIFWGVIAVWLLAMFFAIYLLTKRFLKKKGTGYK